MTIVSIIVGLLTYWLCGTESMRLLEYSYANSIGPSFIISGIAMALSGLFSGFVAGVVAKDSPVAHTVLMAVLLFSIFIICEGFVRIFFGIVLGGLKPLSFDLGLTLCGMVGMVFGGWICTFLPERKQ